MWLSYTGEVLAAVLTGSCVSPLVVMVDKAIFSNASGRMTYNTSFKDCILLFLMSPKDFFTRKAFRWGWTVYTCTFIVSNCSERWAMSAGHAKPHRTQLAAVCAVNIPLSTMRDRYLVSQYSIQPRIVSLRTTICFILRDVITMIGAFSAIGPASDYLQTNYGFPSIVATFTSQMTCPVLAQLFNTPVFLYGLHVHNFPTAKGSQRIQYVWNNYWDAYYYARLARGGTAYSVGGVINRVLRVILTPPYELPKPPEPPEPPQPPEPPKPPDLATSTLYE